jgi:hypothetical protein
VNGAASRHRKIFAARANSNRLHCGLSLFVWLQPDAAPGCRQLMPSTATTKGNPFSFADLKLRQFSTLHFNPGFLILCQTY